MNKKIIYVIGVSGCGKSTIGEMLATKLDYPYYDADDFHPQSNIDKMASGNALTDTDRWPWLQSLNELAKKEILEKGAVIACSALKESYRIKLSDELQSATQWVYLKGSFKQIHDRMKQRDHFMPAALLQSQFDTLEEPKDAITVSIELTPEVIVSNIISSLDSQ